MSCRVVVVSYTVRSTSQPAQRLPITAVKRTRFRKQCQHTIIRHMMIGERQIHIECDLYYYNGVQSLLVPTVILLRYPTLIVSLKNVYVSTETDMEIMIQPGQRFFFFSCVPLR